MSTTPGSPDVSDTDHRCPHCGAEVTAHDSFCEVCGGDLAPTEAAPAHDGTEAPIELSRSIRAPGTSSGSTPAGQGSPLADPTPSAPCPECGGEVGTDGYCLTCGSKAPSPRDHITDGPASWVAGVCDRGRRHHRNEDAMALQADPVPGQRAVLVVCDGVSTAPDSDVASMAAATAARDLLSRHRPAGLGTTESRASAMAASLVEACSAADRAVAAGVSEAVENSPSCTFAAAVVDADLCVYGVVGDSRVYWLPDTGPASQLSEDDSVAAMRVAAGVEREVAENSPGAHAITRWLGPDSPDTQARTGVLQLDRPGWVVVCSDGLWNYASDADRLQQLVAEQAAAGVQQPLALADALVDWANGEGGRDNITVALARIGPATTREQQPDVADHPRTGTDPTAAQPGDHPVDHGPHTDPDADPLEADQPTRNLSAAPRPPAAY